MLTFKATINNIAAENIFKNPPPDFEFTFSKRRILFSQDQIDNYKFYTNIFYTQEFNHQTEYTLSIVYDKNDKKQYEIKFEKTIATLKVNWFNRIKLKIIHDLIKLPKWLKSLISKIFDKGLDAIALIIVAFVSYKLGVQNGEANTKSIIKSELKHADTTISFKERTLTNSSNSITDTLHHIQSSKSHADPKNN